MRIAVTLDRGGDRSRRGMNLKDYKIGERFQVFSEHSKLNGRPLQIDLEAVQFNDQDLAFLGAVTFAGESRQFTFTWDLRNVTPFSSVPDPPLAFQLGGEDIQFDVAVAEDVGASPWDPEQGYLPGDKVLYDGRVWAALGDIVPGMPPDDIYDAEHGTGHWKPAE